MDRIVFLDRGTIKADIRRPAIPHEWIDYEVTAPDQVIERLRGATIAITNKVPINAAAISALPDLKLIVVAATGVDNIDLEACKERGIRVANARDYSRHSVAEHVFMLMLALRRNLFRYYEAVRNGAWQRAAHFCLLDYPLEDLQGATLGIIGYGAIGREVERLALAFGMHVLRAERKGARQVRAGRTPFAEVLRRSDVVTLHTPLTPETQNLIGREELALMRSDAILINCARGRLVDERALAEALREGRLAGAGIDVLSQEPPREVNQLLAADIPNLIITPHNAWASRRATQNLVEQITENIESFARGELQNAIV